MLDPPSLVSRTRDNTARGDIAIHDHVCGIYDTRKDQYVPACKFLNIGLARHEQCLYITEHLTPAALTTILEAHGVDVTAATKIGALKVLSGEEVRSTLGGFTPEAMFTFLANSVHAARAGGFTAFRWGADMTWLRKDDIEPVEMLRFEAELNPFLQKHHLAGLCQYVREDFKPELLIAAAETHPLLVYNEMVCDNFYYVPPEEYLNPGFPALKLERMLYYIISRERLMQKFLT